MPDDNNTSTPVNPPVDPVSAVPPTDSDSSTPDPIQSSATVVPEPLVTDLPEEHDIKSKVAHEIAESQNVLVALSSDPSVDEMAAAIGLSLFLDRLGKRATAIYSGTTPNALEFLKPEDTFEPSTDTLQDFVVALNKEKADHVRCKVDGDFVKMYITPYRTKVSEEDLDFSYGDYNVDLVLALDVANGIDLDSALREHGRIMHNASVINVTTGNPGRFGEIEWSDKTASSISEMFADLIFNTNTKAKLSPDEATAFLTGIVAATDRFSTAATTPQTMKVASKLMEAGANQQLISQNITEDIENEMFSISSVKKEDNKGDLAKIEIEHFGEEELLNHEKDDSSNKEKEDKTQPVKQSDDSGREPESKTKEKNQEDSLLADLEQAAANLAQAGEETVPTPDETPIKINSNESSDDLLTSGSQTETIAQPSAPESFISESADLESTEPFTSEPSIPEPIAPKPTEPSTPEPVALEPAEPEPASPITMNVPQVPSVPEVNEVPKIDYNIPSEDSSILPPPPAPPINDGFFAPVEDTTNAPAPISETEPQSLNSTAPEEPIKPEDFTKPDDSTQVEDQASPSLGSQPVMQDQVYHPQASDPSAFKIPGL